MDEKRNIIVMQTKLDGGLIKTASSNNLGQAKYAAANLVLNLENFFNEMDKQGKKHRDIQVTVMEITQLSLEVTCGRCGGSGMGHGRPGDFVNGICGRCAGSGKEPD